MALYQSFDSGAIGGLNQYTFIHLLSQLFEVLLAATAYTSGHADNQKKK